MTKEITPSTDDGSGNTIEAVIGQVKDGIRLARRLEGTSSGSSKGIVVEVSKVELILKTAIEKSVGGGFSWKVLEIGGGRTVQDTQTVEITLVPPQESDTIEAQLGIDDRLALAIRNIQRSLLATASTEPRFDLETAAVELNFVVTNEGKIDVVVRGAYKGEETQTAKVYLQPTAVSG